MAKVARAFAVEEADREELFQAILVALWRSLPQFNREAKLSTYVYRVALSCGLNWQRSRRRYQRKLENYTVLQSDPTADLSPDDREKLRWLHERIHALPPVDRSLILLSLDRVNYGEIAEITGLSESNVGVRLHRIKQQLIEESKEVGK